MVVNRNDIGKDIVAFLDRSMHDLRASGEVVTGIVIGSQARRELSRMCQEIMGQSVKEDITVNRFRDALLIDDGEHPTRVEIIHAKRPVLPRDLRSFTLRSPR